MFLWCKPFTVPQNDSCNLQFMKHFKMDYIYWPAGVTLLGHWVEMRKEREGEGEGDWSHCEEMKMAVLIRWGFNKVVTVVKLERVPRSVTERQSLLYHSGITPVHLILVQFVWPQNHKTTPGACQHLQYLHCWDITLYCESTQHNFCAVPTSVWQLLSSLFFFWLNSWNHNWIVLSPVKNLHLLISIITVGIRLTHFFICHCS